MQIGQDCWQHFELDSMLRQLRSAEAALQRPRQLHRSQDYYNAISAVPVPVLVTLHIYEFLASEAEHEIETLE